MGCWFIDMGYPSLYIGCMSQNVVDSVISLANEKYITLGLIPSRRQVDYYGGYMCNWNTRVLYEYVKSRTELVFLCRDHAGPSQGNDHKFIYNDGGRKSIKTDVRYMDIIHIDPWKIIDMGNFHAGVNYTIDLLKYCFSLNPMVEYEIGTEEAIFPYTPDQLNDMIKIIKSKVNSEIFSNIRFACIQSGVGLDLLNRKNIGKFNIDTLNNFVHVCTQYNILSKEHNGDFLTIDEIKMRFEQGLGGINIAPELSCIESEIIWELLEEKELYELLIVFFNLCKDYAAWLKWLPEDFTIEKVDKRKFSIAFGHYIYTHERFKTLKEQSGIEDHIIQSKIKNRIMNIYESTGQENNSVGS